MYGRLTKKLQLNNAGGRLYFTHPHIPETETKQNYRRSAETKPRPSAVLFYFIFISPRASATGFRDVKRFIIAPIMSTKSQYTDAEVGKYVITSMKQ